jgi:hypothetical protein
MRTTYKSSRYWVLRQIRKKSAVLNEKQMRDYCIEKCPIGRDDYRFKTFTAAMRAVFRQEKKRINSAAACRPVE